MIVYHSIIHLNATCKCAVEIVNHVKHDSFFKKKNLLYLSELHNFDFQSSKHIPHNALNLVYKYFP